MYINIFTEKQDITSSILGNTQLYNLGEHICSEIIPKYNYYIHNSYTFLFKLYTKKLHIRRLQCLLES